MPEYWARRAIRVLVTPVGLALIAAVRLLIISNYNVTTAVTVAESGGYVNTFLGSLIPLVPAFLPYLALVFLAFRRFILCALTIVATALISPVVRPPIAALRNFDDYWISAFHWVYLNLVAAATIAFGIWVITIMIPWHLFRGSWLHLLLGALWACAAVFALIPYFLTAYPAPSTQSFYASYLRQPWLTAEQITVDPSKVYQGYVLSSDDQWMTVLLYQSRTIAYFRADSVTARIVCEPPTKPTPSPLIRLLNAKSPSIPDCRNSDSWTVAQHGARTVGTKSRRISEQTAIPVGGAEGGVVSPQKQPPCCRSENHGGRNKSPSRRPSKAFRPPAPSTRFDHRYRIATKGRGRMHKADSSPRSPLPGGTQALSGELFLLCTVYRDKPCADVAQATVRRSLTLASGKEQQTRPGHQGLSRLGKFDGAA